ncbi:MAG: hypothetical protein RLP14_10420 [Owenweeksia sp.]
MQPDTDHIIETLTHITKTQKGTIERDIAEEALTYQDEPEGVIHFFKDLLQYGCISGMVSSLIYYIDTHDFYDRHYDQIERLRHSLENETGIPLHPQGDLKNWYAWMGFEETARQMADDLGLEI